MKQKLSSVVRWAVVLATALLAPVFAGAQIYSPVADTYISAANPTIAFGGGGTMLVGSGSYGLVLFDLSRLAAAGVTQANIQQATMTLYANKVLIAGGLDFAALTGPWSESQVTYGTAPGYEAVFQSDISVSATGSFITVDVTAEVRNWLSGAPNYGFEILPSSSAPATSLLIDTKESVTTSHPAYLAVLLASVGPVGPTGPQGATGPAGETGATGPAGSPATPVSGTICGLSTNGGTIGPTCQGLTVASQGCPAGWTFNRWSVSFGDGFLLFCSKN